MDCITTETATSHFVDFAFGRHGCRRLVKAFWLGFEERKRFSATLLDDSGFIAVETCPLMSAFGPSLFAIYKQARAASFSDTQSPQRRQQQKERVAVAMLGFVLKHQADFRAAFLRAMCGDEPQESSEWTIELEVAGCGDLAVSSKSFVAVFELKIDAPLEPHQLPDATRLNHRLTAAALTSSRSAIARWLQPCWRSFQACRRRASRAAKGMAFIGGHHTRTP